MTTYRFDAIDPYGRWSGNLSKAQRTIRANTSEAALRIATKRVEHMVRAEASYWSGGDQSVPVEIEIIDLDGDQVESDRILVERDDRR